MRSALERIEDPAIQWSLPEDRPDDEITFSGGLGLPLFELLMILGGITIGVVLVLLFVSYFRNRAPVERDDDELLTERPAPAIALSDRPLDAAAAAARDGRYDEAVHLLLLGTIEEIRTALHVDVHPSWTSREVSRRAPLPEAGRSPLGDLVSIVERSHFGGAEVTAEQYAASLEHHRALRAACTGGRT